MKFIIGLTGQSGSGKTTLYEKAIEMGFFVINCDEVVHSLYEKREMAELLAGVFSKEIIKDGKINRAALAQKAFSNKENTMLLNQTVLPVIIEEIKAIIDNSNSEKIMLDAPTLFESGADKLCNATIGVLADKKKRLERIISRDNIESKAADLRLSAEKSNDFYVENCDFVIYNETTIDELKSKFEGLLKSILGGSKND